MSSDVPTSSWVIKKFCQFCLLHNDAIDSIHQESIISESFDNFPEYFIISCLQVCSLINFIGSDLNSSSWKILFHSLEILINNGRSGSLFLIKNFFELSSIVVYTCCLSSHLHASIFHHATWKFMRRKKNSSVIVDYLWEDFVYSKHT